MREPPPTHPIIRETRRMQARLLMLFPGMSMGAAMMMAYNIAKFGEKGAHNS